jgi:hypothetical protein
MSWRSDMKALLCALFLLAILAVVAGMPRVTAYNAVVIPIQPVRIAKTYPSIETSFEIETTWDKGALWDDEAPAFDLSRF